MPQILSSLDRSALSRAQAEPVLRGYGNPDSSSESACAGITQAFRAVQASACHCQISTRTKL